MPASNKNTEDLDCDTPPTNFNIDQHKGDQIKRETEQRVSNVCFSHLVTYC